MKINIDTAGGILNQAGRLTAPNNHASDSDGIGVCSFLMFQLHDLVGGGQAPCQSRTTARLARKRTSFQDWPKAMSCSLASSRTVKRQILGSLPMKSISLLHKPTRAIKRSSNRESLN